MLWRSVRVGASAAPRRRHCFRRSRCHPRAGTGLLLTLLCSKSNDVAAR